ncbi:hypothetical protein KIPB_002309 [Kipferlia bialata]|uniref:IBR domain-containing protein n=1 Tax=Kipferlia bialata TaxID=797122 RepID=A0A391NUU2_9EUKA|nr:hypothetical protein KIPB_002309 [Kipferlia bialata]|eukprot:g2309.t1
MRCIFVRRQRGPVAECQRRAAERPPFTAAEYLSVFSVSSPSLKDAFTAYVEGQILDNKYKPLRLLLVFATGSLDLPHKPITLELIRGRDSDDIPEATRHNTTITVPVGCVANLETSFEAACGAVGITLDTLVVTQARQVMDMNRGINSFSVLSPIRKTCPCCGVAVEKISGCNRISCVCGKHWCWVCGFVGTTPQPVYQHMVDVHKHI